MYQALIIVHVLLAAGIIALVLLQQGRGADAGAAFGSGASGTVFGAQGSASFLTRATAVLATLFFATSLGLAIVGDTRQASEGFMENTAESISTDLPPGQLDLDPASRSDMPELPPANNGSANEEDNTDDRGPPATLDESVSGETQGGSEVQIDEKTRSVPADSERP
jgi:preprotein translocase subunit SecG